MFSGKCFVSLEGSALIFVRQFVGSVENGSPTIYLFIMLLTAATNKVSASPSTLQHVVQHFVKVICSKPCSTLWCSLSQKSTSFTKIL